MTTHEGNPPNGDWIETYTGVQFWPLDPRPDDIRIADIAHALANQCRFTGHCAQFYSVAEHCVRVSNAVPRQHALWGLLHDAAETYLVDLARPLKRLPEFAVYREIEARIMHAVCTRFGLPAEEPAEVRHFDAVLLATEARDLMPRRHPWEALPEPLPEPICPWTAETAEARFREQFIDLRCEERSL